MQVFQIVAGVLILSLLIILLVFCDRKVLPRCCPCFKKLIDFIKSKIMFNSLLRAILQTFLLTCISMWSAFQSSDVSSSQGVVDIGVAMLILFFALSFPVIVYRLLKQKYNEQDNNLRTPTTKAKYDSVYANIDYYKPKALYNTSLFLARRLSLAFLIVYID